jgi:hypothetical protein
MVFYDFGAPEAERDVMQGGIVHQGPHLNGRSQDIMFFFLI